MGDHPFRAIVTRAHPVGSLARFVIGSAAIFAFALLPSLSFGVGKQQSAQQNQPKKVWTNSDLDQLRERDAVSIIGVSTEEEAPPEPAPGAQGATGKVWTNEDLEKLGNISIVPASQPAPEQAAPPAAGAPPAAAAPPSEAEEYSPFQDPVWYEKQAYDLHTQLASLQYELQQYEEAIALARDERITQPGVALFGPTELFGPLPGPTPDEGVKDLSIGVRQVEIQLANLRDLARRNGIPLAALSE